MRKPEYGVKRSVMVCANSGYTRMLFMENRFSARMALVGDPTIVPGSPAGQSQQLSPPVKQQPVAGVLASCYIVRPCLGVVLRQLNTESS